MLDAVVTATENVSISSMAKLYSVLSMCIYQQRENPDKTVLVEVIFFVLYYFCHMLLCVYAMHMYLLTIIYHSLLLSCLCSQDFNFRLEDIYSSSKPIVEFGIIVGNFSRKSQQVHLHRLLKPLNLSVTSSFPELFQGSGGSERRALFSVCHFLFPPLKAGTHGNTWIAPIAFLKRN